MKTNELLRFCRKRLRELYSLGQMPAFMDRPTRHELMRQAATGRGIVARSRADSFSEIIHFILIDMGENVKYAPYVLQAWVDGVYFYYDGSNWVQSPEGAKQFDSFVEAEAFIQQNFDPNAARDAILVVPTRELVE